MVFTNKELIDMSLTLIKFVPPLYLEQDMKFRLLKGEMRGLCGAVVTLWPPTSEVGGSNPRPFVGKLVIAYQWSAVYSTEPSPTVCTGFDVPTKLPLMT